MQSPVDSFTQVSMVNAISTIIGGTHVNSISNYISNGVREYILKSNKDLVIKPLDVKNKILIIPSKWVWQIYILLSTKTRKCNNKKGQ